MGMRSSLHTPDASAAEEFAAVFRRKVVQPEKRLFAAVLANALFEFEDRVSPSSKQDDWALDELIGWFFSHDRTWPFSFENLCDYLDLNPECIRKKIDKLLLQRRRAPLSQAS